MRHIFVAGGAGTFAGWPANNGVWNFDGRELLVGFTWGRYAADPAHRGHRIEQPYSRRLARSRDGGETWSVEVPDNFSSDLPELAGLPEPLDFSNPDLALRVHCTGYHASDEPRGSFLLSRDRGRMWTGPYGFGGLAAHAELGGLEITGRTDTLVALYYWTTRERPHNHIAATLWDPPNPGSLGGGSNRRPPGPAQEEQSETV